MILERPSAHISFFEAGQDSDLPAMVLLPGLCCSAQRLLTALLPLAAKSKIVAVEWRGHGKSSSPKDCSIKDLADDVMAVIRSRLRGSRLCILGHSMGARVLWNMWDTFKQELSPILEGVAIIDQTPSPSTGRTMQGPADHVHAMFKHNTQQISGGKAQMMAVFEQLWGAVDSGFMHSRAEFEKWLKFASQCNPVAVSKLHWDALTSDYTRSMESLNKMVLLMVGDSTLSADTVSQRYAACIPPQGAHFALFIGGKHCLHCQHEQLPTLHRLVEQLVNGSLEPNSSPGRLEGFARQSSVGVLVDATNLNNAFSMNSQQKHALPRGDSFAKTNHIMKPVRAMASFVPAPMAGLVPAAAAIVPARVVPVAAYSNMLHTARLRV
jgi:pimeloyl-ACP methyl ester carboxylesterase